MGLEDERVDRGRGVGGSKEWRQEVGWSTDLKNLRESCSLRSAKLGIFAKYSAEVYLMLVGTHTSGAQDG